MSRSAWSLLTVGATLAAAGCGGGGEPGRLPRAVDPVDVFASTVEHGAALEAFAATVVSEREAEVATRVSGRVERVAVDVGTRVRAGDELVVLDRGDVDARVAAARARETLAEQTFGRVENLARQGAASRQELDQSRAQLDGARAALEEATAQEAYSVVRAPFDGVVSRRHVDAGDLAVPGATLVSMVAPGALKIVADVPASRASALPVGAPVTVRVGETTMGVTIDRVVPVLVGAARTLRVEARLPGAGGALLAGAYARIEVDATGHGSRWVPRDALVTRGQLTGIYAVEGDTLRLRWVRLGRRREGAVEMLAGPPGTLRVVRRPAAGLFDGQAVGSVRDEAWAVSDGPTATTPEVDR